MADFGAKAGDNVGEVWPMLDEVDVGAELDADGVRPALEDPLLGGIAEMLTERGFPVESIPGGVRVFGVVPASGLRHQTDAGITCLDAYVRGEWKSYRGPVPKNEMLRFKAATDDLYESMLAHRPRKPVLRLFGVAGDGSDELRAYAARHGIALVERTRWPAPVLADPQVNWASSDGPSETDRRRLAWLARPLQVVYPQLPDGSLRLPQPLPPGAVHDLLELQTMCLSCAGEYLFVHPDRVVAVLEEADQALPRWGGLEAARSGAFRRRHPDRPLRPHARLDRRRMP